MIMGQVSDTNRHPSAFISHPSHLPPTDCPFACNSSVFSVETFVWGKLIAQAKRFARVAHIRPTVQIACSASMAIHAGSRSARPRVADYVDGKWPDQRRAHRPQNFFLMVGFDVVVHCDVNRFSYRVAKCRRRDESGWSGRRSAGEGVTPPVSKPL